LSHRTSRPWSEIKRLLLYPVMPGSSPSWQPKLSQAGTPPVHATAQPGHPGPGRAIKPHGRGRRYRRMEALSGGQGWTWEGNSLSSRYSGRLVAGGRILIFGAGRLFFGAQKLKQLG